MSVAVQYIDTAMVGSLGTYATAAVGSTTTVNWLVGSTISAMSVGFLAYIARARGAGDHALASRAVAQAVLITVVAGILFTALTVGLSGYVPVLMQVNPAIRDLAARYFLIIYSPMLFRTAIVLFGTVLRASGDSKTPMRIGLMMNAVNVALNLLLIYPAREAVLFGHAVRLWGAGWGVEGAAAASAVSFVIGGVCMTTALWRHPEMSPRGQSLRPDFAVLGACMRIAMPNMLQRFATSLGYVVFAAMINALGETATAAHTIANTVESAFYIPGFGMQTAAATLAGNAYGAQDNARMRRLAHMIIFIEISMMTISGAALFAAAPWMVRLFTDSTAVTALSVTVLRMVAVSEPIYGVSIAIEGMMNGVGETKRPFVFNTAGMWGVRILGTLLCTRVFGLGLPSAWVCMIAHNAVLFVLFLAYYRRGTWNPMEKGNAL
ncbi:MAG: MATE family efflux transporter [Oscillospiraceae bacterium]|nr:MATE family efflux transporter [Oscillospiraceae bacterium]